MDNKYRIRESEEGKFYVQTKVCKMSLTAIPYWTDVDSEGWWGGFLKCQVEEYDTLEEAQKAANHFFEVHYTDKNIYHEVEIQ